jgi:hypothetical protein
MMIGEGVEEARVSGRLAWVLKDTAEVEWPQRDENLVSEWGSSARVGV